MSNEKYKAIKDLSDSERKNLINIIKNVKSTFQKYAGNAALLHSASEEQYQKEKNRFGGAYNNELLKKQKETYEAKNKYIFETKRKERLEIIEKILNIYDNYQLDKKQKHELLEESYHELSKLILSETLECLRCDLKTVQAENLISKANPISRETGSEKKYYDYANKIDELRKRLTKIERLKPEESLENIREIDYNSIITSHGNDIVDLMYPDEFEIDKKRAV